MNYTAHLAKQMTKVHSVYVNVDWFGIYSCGICSNSCHILGVGVTFFVKLINRLGILLLLCFSSNVLDKTCTPICQLQYFEKYGRV